ncbi:Mu homology domain-containing protein, partial [Dunaliella salina]
MLSQFYILSARGDVIIRRDYLGNVPKNSAETFFRNAKFWKEGDEAPPVFNIDGVTYLHVKDGGVEVVATTRANMSPSFVLEFLRRICTIIKDYCGMLSEDAIRKNFVLVYELLDEVIDYGYPQSTSTDALKMFVLNEPSPVAPPAGINQMFGLHKGPTGVFKSVLDTNRTDGKGGRDEIFVDVVERLTCTFNATGTMSQAQVDGAIQVKSYLTGNPPIKIKLNDDLIIGACPLHPQISGSNSCFINLHFWASLQVANLDSFDIDRTISLKPAEGEFALMNYRTSTGFKPPFRLTCSVDSDPNSPLKAIMIIKLWCEIPSDKSTSGLEVEVPTPRYVQRVHCDLDSKAVAAQQQSWDYNEKTHMLKWKFKKCSGGQEFTMRSRLTLEKPFVPSLRTE